MKNQITEKYLKEGDANFKSFGKTLYTKLFMATRPKDKIMLAALCDLWGHVHSVSDRRLEQHTIAVIHQYIDIIK